MPLEALASQARVTEHHQCAATPCAVGARASASELARQAAASNTITGLGTCKMKERRRKAAPPR
ncbi:MAG: hypothetical protein ABSB49_13880 [Polyangia bacterium]